MIIRLCQPGELDAIYGLIADCKTALREAGIQQWTEAYPNVQIIASDIESRTLFGIYQDELCLGIVCLNEDQAEGYADVDWKDTEGKALVVHRLAIRPEYQREGLGLRLMEFAETHGRENGYTSIRLDTYSANHRAQQFYDRLQYQKRGEVYFPGRELAFYCLEKSLA